VDAKVADASRDKELAKVKEELARVSEEATTLKTELARMRGNHAITEEQLEAVERAASSVHARLEAARAREEDIEPRLRHELGLYVNICPIKWDLDAGSGCVRGCECLPSRGCVCAGACSLGAVCRRSGRAPCWSRSPDNV
jgi:isocitrate/isopropylmalate dehydrogenase